MPLVSYADSDDSGEEGINEPQVKKNEAKNENTVNKPGIADSSSKEPKQKSNDGDSDKSAKPKSIGSLFSSLPAPWKSTVSWANKAFGGHSGSKLKQKENTVKISVPSPANDSDSDDEVSVRTSHSDSQNPSSLFSILPKPKHSVVVKENNPNRPAAKMSNRQLIPDSLRRKQAKKPKPKTKKLTSGATNEDSDDDSDDGEGGSFFSWNEKETSSSNASNISVTKSTAIDEENMPLLGQSQKSSNTDSAQTFSRAVPVSNIVSNKQSECLDNRNLYTDNTQGYSYQGNSNPTDYSVSYQTHHENAGYTDPNYPQYDYYSSETYNQASTSQQEQTNPDWQTSVPPDIQETPEEITRFLGKRGRGEPNINIIDVNVDDQVGSSQEWKAHIQKEDADYKPPSKKKDNLPSSQQRRKHQITYLAFQAKEKEWELRNQWSANRQTRRQTQSKYGF